MFTDREKWQAAERELNMRRKVYPHLVRQRRMTQIALMNRRCISVSVPG
jgi:hypothetical protein